MFLEPVRRVRSLGEPEPVPAKRAKRFDLLLRLRDRDLVALGDERRVLGGSEEREHTDRGSDEHEDRDHHLDHREPPLVRHWLSSRTIAFRSRTPSWIEIGFVAPLVATWTETAT